MVGGNLLGVRGESFDSWVKKKKYIYIYMAFMYIYIYIYIFTESIESIVMYEGFSRLLKKGKYAMSWSVTAFSFGYYDMICLWSSDLPSRARNHKPLRYAWMTSAISRREDLAVDCNGSVCASTGAMQYYVHEGSTRVQVHSDWNVYIMCRDQRIHVPCKGVTSV